MKIFITGATGVLGKRVVKKLVKQNHEVIGLARSDANEALLTSMHAGFCRGDLFNVNQMTEFTKDCDAILHLATSIPKVPLPKKKDWETNDRIRREGISNLISAAFENNILIFLQQSVTFVFGDHKGEIVNAQTPIDAAKVSMLQSAVEMERMVREKLRTDYVILRFGSFYSADSYQTLQLIEGVRRRRMPVIGDGNYYWNFIHADDAASAVVYSLENFQRLKGHTINFTDFSPLLYREMLDTLIEKTKSKRPLRIPLYLAKMMLGKDVFNFITMSYRVAKEDLISDWNPAFRNFDEGIGSIISAIKS